jgi:N-acetylglucosamine kinase-like BadF-type ATPase
MYRLIADSGSTKTDWVLAKDGEVVRRIKTMGLNPYLNPKEAIITALRTELLTSFSTAEIKDTLEVEFYGAGCSNAEKKRLISDSIHSFFPLAEIVVEHDLLGAAKAVCGTQPGIAAILGTGSNSCYYDGQKIVKNVISLGFILGDEGSGCYIGKQLIADFLNQEMPERLHRHLQEDLGLCKDQIFDSVYKKARPNRYLASFTKWIDNYYNEFDYLHELIKRSFNDFFIKSLLKYENHKEMPINVVGSVGHRFSKELKEVAAMNNCSIGTIIKSPIDGLIR